MPLFPLPKRSHGLFVFRLFQSFLFRALFSVFLCSFVSFSREQQKIEIHVTSCRSLVTVRRAASSNPTNLTNCTNCAVAASQRLPFRCCCCDGGGQMPNANVCGVWLAVVLCLGDALRPRGAASHTAAPLWGWAGAALHADPSEALLVRARRPASRCGGQPSPMRGIAAPLACSRGAWALSPLTRHASK